MGLLNLTESERLEILNLHNNARIIKEQATSLVAPTGTAAPASSAAAPAAPAAAPSVESVVKELQTLLNTKYGAKLTVDGKWGNLTQTAFDTALKSKGAVTPKTVIPGTPDAPNPTVQKTVIPGTPDAPNPTVQKTVIPGTPDAPNPTVQKTVIPGTPDAPNPNATPATGTTPAAPAASTTTAPAASTTTAPAASTTTVPDEFGGEAPATPAAPLSNRDQRRQRQDLRRGNRRAMQDLRANQRTQQ
jgi:hypothetical protein